MSEKFKYVGSSYLILTKDNNILLLKRQNTGFMDGYYSLPAGHLEGNETARQGGAREIKEEIGIDVKPSDLQVVHVMHRKAANDERIDFFVTTEKYTGEIKNCEPDKCSELTWFPLHNLPTNTIDFIDTAIKNYQNKVFYSEFGWE